MRIEFINRRVHKLRDELLGHSKEYSLNKLDLSLNLLKPFLSKGQRVRFNHLMNSRRYDPDGDLNKWPNPEYWSHNLADFIVNSGVLPKPKGGRKVIILAPASNSGAAETIMQNELGEGYKFIPGDLSRVKPYDKSMRHYRMDASYLPFADGFCDVVLDTLGAMHYEAIEKWGARKLVTKLFEEYRRVLGDNGMVIIDMVTLENVKKALSVRGNVEGFTHEDIGWRNFKFRIYRKIAEKEIVGA